ncbi:gliding motility-associated C-terminal domain-containing protein [Larkinella insperata]|uniref:Gliding motility-associated C-terminal domain-containing protein n=1 Tax=Larkinella insperata TaxID=332158 RepID=A0ABW3QJB4_9BACT|nr:gliding motility-associated C-terminal domain-containing protein [Larkinella insperata]
MLAVCSSLLANAQNGRFDVRLQLKKADCANQKLFVAVELKAHDESSSFLMGNANLRFSYDTRLVKSPVIVEEQNFTSQGVTGNLNYSPLSLNGSVERSTKGIVSLNVLYSGSEQGATLVTTNWMPVATLQFDVVSLTEKSGMNLEWHNDQSFPVTGLSEVVLKENGSGFDYDSYVAKAGGVFENISIASMANLCSGTSTESSGEVAIPEGFSPNGDGKNDQFVIRNLGQLKAEVTIFDRNGTVIYESKEYQNDWDGRNGGKLLPVGTYFYSIQLSDGRKFTRALTLSR